MSGSESELTIDFGKKLDLSNIKFFAENLLPITGNESAVKFELSIVEKFDTSAVQLLYMLYKSAVDQQLKVVWSDISSQAKEAIDTLGMSNILFDSEG